MTASTRKETAAALLGHAGQGEIAQAAALLTDDFELEQMVHDPDTATAASGMVYDRASYLGFLGAIRDMTQSGMNLAVELMVEEGDHIAVFGRSDAISPGGWRYRNAYCWHLSFRGAKVRRMREFYDTTLSQRLIRD